MIEALFVDLTTIAVVSGFIWFFVNGYVSREHPRLLKYVFYYFTAITTTILILAIIMITTKQ
jgi:hypothetical protein